MPFKTIYLNYIKIGKYSENNFTIRIPIDAVKISELEDFYNEKIRFRVEDDKKKGDKFEIILRRYADENDE